MEPRARVLDPLSKNFEGPPLSDLLCEPREKARFHVRPVLPFEPFPLLRLGRPDEVEDQLWVEAEGAVVLLRAAPKVALLQKSLLDGGLKVLL